MRGRLERVAGRFRCLVRGHSRHVAFSYLYRPGAVVDGSVTCRCVRCGSVIPSSTTDGVVTLKPFRMEKPKAS